MKTILILITLFFFASINQIRAQEIITSKHSLDRISNHKKDFKNQPLSLFLEKLKIDIKSVTYERESESNPNQITLKFDERVSYNKMRKKNISPSRIIIQFTPSEETKNIFKKLSDIGIIEQHDDIAVFLKKIGELKIFAIYGYNEKIN